MEPVQAEPKPEPTPEPSQGGPDGGGFHRSSVIRVGLLLVAVVGIAAAGIVIGKAIEPSSSVVGLDVDDRRGDARDDDNHDDAHTPQGLAAGGRSP